MSSRNDPARRLAAEVARAGRRGSARTLLLDLDGTLAPIAPTPDEVRVPPETLEAIARLVVRGWRVAIVSGRPASEVRALVRVQGVRVVGSHGVEFPGGSRLSVSRAMTRRLSAIVEAGMRLARRFAGARVETKPTGVAFHDRGVRSDGVAAWRLAVRRLLSSADLTGLEIVPGRSVLEVRPLGAHKGTALRLLRPVSRDGSLDAGLVAVGDDRTDEDLFRAIRGRGLGVRVGRPMKSTAATRRLASPSAVRRFLEALAEETT